ncbi:MAG: accessory gene regulator B family protein [Ruminococcus sp.]
MIHRISESIAGLLLRNEIVCREEKEIYVYGLEVGIGNALLLVALLVVSLLFGYIQHYLVFLMVFLPLRVFAGGIHAKTQLRCFIVSVSTYLLSLLAAEFASAFFRSPLMTAIAGVMLLITAAIAPVEHKNNPLLPEERNRNRKIVQILLPIDLIIYILFFLWFPKMASSMVILILVHFILMMFGKMTSYLSKDVSG